MEERHKFLTEQLEDLRRTRKDLLDIVREVDARVEQVFTEAYADVEKAFDQTFARLFPGGEGRLVLTDPDDMLNTGIEVEARPAGQEGQAALAALRWRALAGRGRVPGRALQGPAVAVLHPRRGRGGARRHQPRPPAPDLRGAARELPAPRDHPPEAHDGGRRRALRRHDARRRRLRGDQPAARAALSAVESRSATRAARPPGPTTSPGAPPPRAGATTTPTATSTTRPTTSCSTPRSTPTSTRRPASTCARCRRSASSPRPAAATSARSASPSRSRWAWSSTRSAPARSSTGSGCSRATSDEAAAEGRFVHVYVDNTRGAGARPVTPIPDVVRAAVVRLLPGT